MTLNGSDIQEILFGSIRKKIGNIAIRLESTPNGRARVTIGTNRRDFINRKDALQWLIHAYNIKDFKNYFTPVIVKETLRSPVVKKRKALDNSATEIYEKIIEFDYYSTEIYRNVVNDFEGLKTENGYSDEEVTLVYGLVIDALQKLMDETFHHKRSQTYKQYLDQLKMRTAKRF